MLERKNSVCLPYGYSDSITDSLIVNVEPDYILILVMFLFHFLCYKETFESYKVAMCMFEAAPFKVACPTHAQRYGWVSQASELVLHCVTLLIAMLSQHCTTHTSL